MEYGTTYGIASARMSATYMNVLTRQQVIDQLRALEHNRLDAQQLAAWAFDQFYGEESGALVYESGYRAALAGVLDDLMFADQPGFQVSVADAQHMIARLEAAEAVSEDEEEADDDDNDDEG